MTREVEFGSFNDSDDSDDSEDEIKTLVQRFDMNRLLSTSKLSGLSNKIHVYTSKNLPLMYKLNVGSLGKMHIYIKERDTSE